MQVDVVDGILRFNDGAFERHRPIRAVHLAAAVACRSCALAQTRETL
jgi:hypothetical protein